MSGLVTPNRITGDMGGLLSDGSDDDAVEGEVWDDEEEDWDELEEKAKQEDKETAHQRRLDDINDRQRKKRRRH